jgi:hypothetical protein
LLSTAIASIADSCSTYMEFFFVLFHHSIYPVGAKLMYSMYTIFLVCLYNILNSKIDSEQLNYIS